MSFLSKTFPIRMVRTRRHIYSPREVNANTERKSKRNSLLDVSRNLLNVEFNENKKKTGTKKSTKPESPPKTEVKKRPGRKRQVNKSKNMKVNQNESLKNKTVKRKADSSFSGLKASKKRRKSDKNLLNFFTSTPKVGVKRRIRARGARGRGKNKSNTSFSRTIVKNFSFGNSGHFNSTIKLNKSVNNNTLSKPSSSNVVEIVETKKTSEDVIDLISDDENDVKQNLKLEIPAKTDDSVIVLDETGSASFKNQPFEFPTAIKQSDTKDSIIILDDTDSVTFKCSPASKASIGIQISPQFPHKNNIGTNTTFQTPKTSIATNTSKRNSPRGAQKTSIATNTTINLTRSSKTRKSIGTESAQAPNLMAPPAPPQMNLNFSAKTSDQITDFIKRIAHLEEQFLKHAVSTESTNQQQPVNNVNTANTFGSNIYNPCVPPKRGLRLVVIDGSNVAMGHSNGKYFSCEGLKICIDYFLKRGHEVKAFVPQYRRQVNQSSNPTLLENLAKAGLVIFTPSRRVYGRMIVPYDDRYIVQCAAERGGVIVSNDNYRDLLQENPSWRETIERRLLMWTWCGNMIMFPVDPCGRGGPSLDQFLRF